MKNEKFRIDLMERRIIQDLLDHGTQIKDIASVLNRSSGAIYQEIKKNGGVRLYNADQAQNKSDEDKKNSNKDKNSPLQHLRKRVDELERKMEMLYEK